MFKWPDMKTNNRSIWKVPLALLVVSLVTRVLLAYRGGMSDPDSVAIAAGMARYFSSDTSFGDIILYGRQMNPGIYLLFRAVYPFLFDSPSQVIPFLNIIGVASAVLLPLPLYYIFRRRLGEGAAAAAVLLFVFTPLVWESSLSFHPVLPASLLLSLALLTWRRIDASVSGAVWFAVSCLLVTSAVVIRFELLMLAPAFLLACLLSKDRRRDISLFVVISAIAVGTHWLVLHWLPGAHTTAGKGISDYTAYISGAWFSSLRPAGMVKTLIWFFFGAGSATLVLVLWRLIRFRRCSPDLKNLAVVIVMILPTLLFWLPQPRAAILRHYFLIMPAIAWLAGDLVFRRMERRRLTSLLCMVIVLNLILPEMVYFTWNRLHPGNTKTPHGTVFLYRNMINDHIERYSEMQSGIRLVAEKASNTVASDSQASGLPPAAFIPVSWEAYAYALYGMAQDTSLVELDIESEVDDVGYHRYDLGGAEVRIVFSNSFTWDVLPGEFIPYIRSASDEGFTIVIPCEIIGSAPEQFPAWTNYIKY